MSSAVSFAQAFARLHENGLDHGVLDLQNGFKLLISRHGGRIFGPFLPQEGESILYINAAFASADAFRSFLNAGEWFLGGERLYIAPEIQYCVPDRGDFFGSYQAPNHVDPGRYTLEQSTARGWRLSQDMTLTAYNLVSGEKRLRLERLIHPVADPLRDLSAYGVLIDGVLYAGYEQVITLTESQRDDIKSEIWGLLPLNAGGELLIPASPCTEVTQYYEPIDAEYCRVDSNHLRLRITGDRRYKVGIKAAHVFGRAGYYGHVSDGRAYLLVNNFFNNPSAGYAEEPYHSPGQRGYSVHVYNDDGALGSFGELECNGQTIGGDTGRSSSTDQMVSWCYVGATDKLRDIALHLLGAEI